MPAQISANARPGLPFSPAAFRWPKRLNLPKLDAADNAFFLRELEHISPKLYKRLYFELKGRVFVPTENEGMSPGDQSFTYRMWDYTGAAQAISDYAKDLPLVNTSGAEASQRLQAYGSGYSYSQAEIAAAAKLNRPLEADRAMVCKEAMDQKVDSICALGDANYGLNGLLTLSGTQTYTPTTKTSGGTQWLDANYNLVATPDEVLADMNGAVRTMITATGGVERPSRIGLPIPHYQAISTRARSAVSDTTILEFFEKNNPDIEVMEWERLLNGNGTAANANRMLVYRPDPIKVKLLMALEFTQLPPEARNLAFVVNAWQVCGGVISPYPQSIMYADGI